MDTQVPPVARKNSGKFLLPPPPPIKSEKDLPVWEEWARHVQHYLEWFAQVQEEIFEMHKEDVADIRAAAEALRLSVEELRAAFTSGDTNVADMAKRSSDSLVEALSKLKDTVNAVKVDVARLQAKSGLYGLLGGLIPAAIALAYFYFKSLP